MSSSPFKSLSKRFSSLAFAASPSKEAPTATTATATAENINRDVDDTLLSRLKFIRDQTVAIVGVPFAGGQARDGVDEGPSRMLDYGLISQLKHLEWNVVFDGQMQNFQQYKPAQDPDIRGMKRPLYVSAVCREVANVCESHARAGQMVLTLGGDHSIAMGTISGTGRVYGDDMCVVWIDAHADINTPDTSPSGNLHGSPLSFLTGVYQDEVFDWCKPFLDKQRLVYIGLRDCDAGEKRILRQHNIKAFSMYEVDKYGIGRVVEMALDHVNPNRDLPIHLSFDVDALDPTVAPSTGTPVRGGLTFREGHYICEALAETGLLVAVDLMEVNPMLGDEKSLMETVTVGCSLVRAALGETLL